MSKEAPQAPQEQAQVLIPRIIITYCTQCNWMLRAAYFAQELLSTFSLSLGEVALRPSTGGIFTVDIIHSSYSSPASTHASTTAPAESSSQAASQRIWDFKTERTFPEVKILKRRVRDIIDPDRDLGHVDKHSNNRTEDISVKKQGNIPCPQIASASNSRSQPKIKPPEEVSAEIDENEKEKGEDDDSKNVKTTTSPTNPQTRNAPSGTQAPSSSPPSSFSSPSHPSKPAQSVEDSSNIRIPATSVPDRRGPSVAAPQTSQGPQREEAKKKGKEAEAEEGESTIHEIAKKELHITASRPPLNTGQNHDVEKERRREFSGVCEDCE